MIKRLLTNILRRQLIEPWRPSVTAFTEGNTRDRIVLGSLIAVQIGLCIFLSYEVYFVLMSYIDTLVGVPITALTHIMAAAFATAGPLQRAIYNAWILCTGSYSIVEDPWPSEQ